MVRSVVLLIFGAVVGSVVVWQLQPPASDPGSAQVSGQMEAPAPVAAEAPGTTAANVEPGNSSLDDMAVAANAGFASQRLAVFERAAGTDDVTELETLIRIASVAADSRLRDLELSVLLARLAEFDPARAVDFAGQLYLDPEFLLPLYRQWASVDPDAAIRALMIVSPASVQREIALELLAVTGFDAAGVAAVARALPEADRKSFEIDALVRQAEIDPVAALTALNGLNDQMIQSLTLSRVAESIALGDPEAAIDLAELIDDESMQTAFRQLVLNAWAQSDPERAFAYVEAADSADIASLTSTLVTLAASDARRAMALADKLPVNQRFIQANIMRELAEQEPDAALAMIADMPLGQERDNLLQSIAQARGRTDPDGALAWARSLEPPSQTAVSAVLRGIADVDFDRAIDLVLEELDSAGPGAGMAMNSASSYMSMLSTLARNSTADNREQFVRLADRLVESNNMLAQSLMSSAISQWARSDPAAAVEWVVSRADKLDSNAFSNVARQLADQDPDTVLATLNRLPEAQRGSWLEGAFSGLASNNIDEAVIALERYRGQAGFGSAYASVAREMARTNPERAARMLDQAPQSNQLSSAAFNISREWAARDPAAAARWAAGQADQQIRNNSISSVMSVWAQRDAAEARRWAMQMSSGPDRDSALRGYAQTIAQGGEFDPQLFGAFSDEHAGQQAAGNAIANIGRTDPDRARQLLDEHIHDEGIRRTTAANLARYGGASSGMIVSSGGIIYLN